jgi:hypothetical protein
MCEQEYNDVALESMSLVSAGGWCCPPDQVYEAFPKLDLCGHCSARWSVMMELGIDVDKMQIRRLT